MKEHAKHNLDDKLKILDSGCEKDKYPGVIGVYNIKLDIVDVVRDLIDFSYPLENQSVNRVILSNILEHFIIEDIIRIKTVFSISKVKIFKRFALSIS